MLILTDIQLRVLGMSSDLHGSLEVDAIALACWSLVALGLMSHERREFVNGWTDGFTATERGRREYELQRAARRA